MTTISSTSERHRNLLAVMALVLVAIVIGVMATQSFVISMFGLFCILLCILILKGLVGVKHLWVLTLLTLPYHWELEVAGVQLNPTELLVLALVLIMVIRTMVRRDYTWLAFPFFGAFVAFLFLSATAHVLGVLVTSPVQAVWHVFKTVLALPLLAIVTYHCVRDKESLKNALALFLVATSVSALVGVVQVVTAGRYLTGHGVYGNLRYLGIFWPYPSGLRAIVEPRLGLATSQTHLRSLGIFRAQGGTTAANYFAIQLLVGVVLAYAWSRIANTKMTERLARLAIGAQGISLILTFSRSAWLALAVGSALLWILKRKCLDTSFPVRLTAGLALLATLLMTSASILPQYFVDRFVSMLNPLQVGAVLDRFSLWRLTLEQLSKRPLLGYGTTGVMGAMFQGHVVTAHNILLSVAYDRGYVGLLAFGLLYAKAMRRSFVIGRLANDPFCHYLGISCFVALVTILVAGVGSSPLLFSETAFLFWFLLGIVSALSRIYQNSGSAGRQSGRDQAHAATLG